MNATARPNIRQHILETAHPLLLRKGFTAVGLAELLAAAHVPKGSFYHYFKSKEAFGEALLEAYFADYLTGMDALLALPGTKAQRLIGYFNDWLDSETNDETRGRCLVVKLGAEVCDLSENMRAALERGTRGVIERLAQCIACDATEGALQAARITATALYERWLGANLLAKIAYDRAPLDEAMTDTKRLLGLMRDA